MAEGRTKKTLRNTLFTFLYKGADIVLSFLLRTVFIHTLGISYLGLSGLFANILTVLSLMELGVGSAIIFSLYKPLAEENHSKVAALMRLYKKVYNIIGALICVIGFALTPFLKYIINLPSGIDNINFIYWASIANTSVTYFLAYRRSLLIADQRADINTMNLIVFRISRFVGLAVVLILTRSYIAYLIVDILNTIVSNIHITIIIKKKYANVENAPIELLTNQEKSNIIRYMSAGIFSKIGQTIVTSTDNIIISAFISTALVGMYSNYTMVISNLDILVYLVFSNITAAVGNYAVEKGNAESEKLFRIIGTANYMVSFCVSLCIYCLTSPFIVIWLGKSFLLPEYTVLIIALNFYLTSNQNCVSNFISSNGELSYRNRFRFLIEAIINLSSSIFFVKYTDLGITGVFLGTTLCFLCGRTWMDAKVLYRHWFHIPFRSYIKRFILRFLLFAMTAVLSKAIVSFWFNTFGVYIWSWILAGCFCCLLSVSVVILVYGGSDESQYIFSLLRKVFDKIKLRNTNVFL